MSGKSPGDPEQLLRRMGERVTLPRVRVLSALARSGRALTHHEIERQLGKEALDKVTLYRVLDWLCSKGLAQRRAGTDRVWRFSAAEAGHERHAHFECSSCGKLVCLQQLPSAALAVNVPRGFRSEGVELTVRGRCAHCA